MTDTSTTPSTKPISFRPLPTLRAAYSDRTAHLMAQLSKLAYIKLETDQGRAELKSRIQPAGFALKNTYWHDPDNEDGAQSDLGLQGFFATHAEFAVLVFRGTNDFKDWQTNINFAREKIPVGTFEGKENFVRVHRGFYRAFEQRRAKIQQDISEIEQTDRTKPIFITGHSLGGAMAQIATATFTSDQIAACYTFGSPRAGGRQLDRFVKPPHYRLTHGFDIVPFTPFSLLDYHHTGDARHIGGTPPRLYRHRRSRTKHAWLWPLAFASVVLRRKFIGTTHHKIDQYVDKLETLVTRRASLTVHAAIEDDAPKP